MELRLVVHLHIHSEPVHISNDHKSVNEMIHARYTVFIEVEPGLGQLTNNPGGERGIGVKGQCVGRGLSKL